MASTSYKPTIVFVPGSFCSGALQWDSVIDKIQDAGYDTYALELPTVGPPSTLPGKTMLDDATHIHGVLEFLANAGKTIVLVMSSYGGVPGTQSLGAGGAVTTKEREQQGKAEGGVVKLVYVSSILVNEGESSNDSLRAFGATAPSMEHLEIAGEYGQLEPVRMASLGWPELSKEAGERVARKMAGHSLRSFGDKMTSTSHYDVPITYVKCIKDGVIQPIHQQKMIDDIKAVTRSTVDVVEIEAGHCPMLEQVDKTAEIILQAIKSSS